MNHPSNPIRAGESLPAVSPNIETKLHPSEIPQREDYVPPVVPSPGFVHVTSDDALAIHKFLEVNAVYPEEKALADKLRGIIEGKI